MTNYKVCPVCKGEGKVTHPAFRNSVMEQDCVEDEEFMEMFQSGGMDVTCECCHGKRVVEKEDMKQFADDEEWRQEMQMEHRMLHGLGD